MNTDKLAINWQNFTQVRLQIKFAFIIRSIKSETFIEFYEKDVEKVVLTLEVETEG